MAQNIENKKTTLSDDASIYQKKEERDSSESVKNNWSNLKGKEKLKYFKDYLLIPILIGIVVIVAVFFFVRSMFRDQQHIQYTVAVMSTKYLEADKVQEHIDELEKVFELEKNDRVELEIGLGKTANAGMAEFMTELMAGTLDVIIGTEKDLEDVSGHFIGLDEVDEVLELVPEEARVSMTYDTKDSDGKDSAETVMCGIKLKYTVFADCIPEGSRYADSLVLVFVRTNQHKGELSKYWRSIQYVMGKSYYESGS